MSASMLSSQMTPKARWLAALTFEPVDRLPFWPKLDAAYPRAQAAPFSGMPISDLHRWIGSDEHAWIPPCTREVRATTSVTETEQGRRRVTVYRTPYGETRMVRQFDPASQAWHPIEFPVRDRATLQVMTAFFEDARVELDPTRRQETADRVAALGQDALVGTSIGESPLMYFVEWLAGIESAHLLLHDHRDEVEALFEAVHRVLLERTEIVARHSPADVLYFTENTSTTLISPRQYRRYCYPHITAYGEIAQRHGRIFVLHMCGKLKRLLLDLATLPAHAFEAFTAPPLGSTTLLDGRTACPDKCLVGGTHAMLWTRPADEIIAEIERALAPLPHHRGIVVTSAGVMPPLCPPEVIKAVCDWVKAYAARV